MLELSSPTQPLRDSYGSGAGYVDALRHLRGRVDELRDELDGITRSVQRLQLVERDDLIAWAKLAREVQLRLSRRIDAHIARLEVGE